MSSNPQPPYFAVIFSSIKNHVAEGYDGMAKEMEKLSTAQPGFLGVQSVRDDSGLGITVSYWKSLEDIANWKSQSKHLEAQRKGKADWYSGYEVRICKVERQYHFGKMEFL